VADPAGGLVSSGNAIVRKLFNWSSNSLLEMQWYLFGAAFMGAAAYTLQQNEHIRIDVFYGTRTRRTQHWIDLFGHVFFTLPFVVLMTWLLVPYALQAFRSGQISTNAGGLIIWPARAILARASRCCRPGPVRDRQEDRRHARGDRGPASLRLGP
jgi:TRAP-type mannitol/chloroaromatic compound transport system permease small subunit